MSHLERLTALGAQGPSAPASLEVVAMGHTDEGLPCAETACGLRFLGLPGLEPYGRQYEQLPAETRAGLPGDLFTVLRDIEVRYFKAKQHRRFVYQPGQTIVELGAYLGYYSMAVARQIGEGGRLLAVELLPELHEILRRNLEGSFPKQGRALLRGVWRERGTQTVYCGGGQINGLRRAVIDRFCPPSRPARSVRVQTDTIDGILDEAGIEHVDLMIVQLNGVELEALAGIRRAWPRIGAWAIAANYDHNGHNEQRAPTAIADRLDAQGYATEIFDRWVYASRWPQSRPPRRQSTAPGPIFIGGCGRSGTTLLRVMLDSHPEVACGPETDLLLAPDRLDVPALAFKLDLDADRVVELAGQSAYRPDFTEALLSDYAARSRKRRWAEKTPRNVRHIEYIFDNFPNAHFIHVIRDGRDVVCSLRTHPKYRIENHRWVPTHQINPMESCIRRWVQDTQAGLAWRGHPRYHEIRYEDLVERPRQVLEPLLAALALPWSDQVLCYDRQHTTSRDAQRFPQNRKATRPLDRSAIGRWRRDLTSEERTAFKEAAGELLTSLEYVTSIGWLVGSF